MMAPQSTTYLCSAPPILYILATQGEERLRDREGRGNPPLTAVFAEVQRGMGRAESNVNDIIILCYFWYTKHVISGTQTNAFLL
jgi:hypothetical protein